MLNDSTEKLKGVLELLINDSNRINDQVPQKYWYPLSMATYDVDEILEALDSLCSFRTSMWHKTSLFESEFSKFNGSKSSIMVNSGSSADLLLMFLLRELKESSNSSKNEIIIPAVTWPTQIWSAMMAGFDVKLIDVDPETLNIDLKQLENAISDNTLALFVVHLMGNPCDMNVIEALSKKHGCYIFEDCCEALGAKFANVHVGNWGEASAFSFFFSHHMTTMEGGMITCGPEHEDALKVLRAHGWTRNINHSQVCEDIDPRYMFINWGFNLRPTDVQAGFGLRQLEKLPEFNKKRQELANHFYDFIYKQEFLSKPKVHALAEPSWLGLPIMINESAPFSVKDITVFLEKSGIETRPIVTGNVLRHPVAKKFNLKGNFPGADKVHDLGFYIGLSPMHKMEDLNKVIDYFQLFLGDL